MLDVRVCLERMERKRSDRNAVYILFEDGFWLWRFLVDALSGKHTVGDLVARLRNES